MSHYVDPRSGETFPLDQPRWCGRDGAPLMLSALPGIGREGVEAGERSLWRYGAALPFRPATPISLGEGCTPLLARRLHGVDVRFKCEWFNPTCSFKDRGTSVMLSLLRDQGVQAVLEDSSGNGGASVAAYAAAGGLAATIMAPSATSPAKTVQMRAHGAAVELVPGTRQDTADAAARRGGGALFYASHNWHPFFLQGTKTLAYELWEDLGWAVPDHVLIPCGAGSNVLGCAIGFGELLRAGAAARMPRLWAVQPSHCGPIAAAALGQAVPPVRPTIAEGTAIAAPIRAAEVVAALRASAGGAVLVAEDAIAAATFDLARIGLYVEPTCAQVAAGLAQLLEAGAISPGETIVLVLTGTGVKATPTVARLLGGGDS